MSRKNRLSTRKNRHKADLEREKAATQKRAAKADKAAKKLAARAPALKPKQKAKAIRVRKHLQVKGVRVVDAESKKRAQELIAADKALQQMEVGSEGDWEEATEEEVAALERDI